jgi:hypothetical protein
VFDATKTEWISAMNEKKVEDAVLLTVNSESSQLARAFVTGAL